MQYFQNSLYSQVQQPLDSKFFKSPKFEISGTVLGSFRCKRKLSGLSSELDSKTQLPVAGILFSQSLRQLLNV